MNERIEFALRLAVVVLLLVIAVELLIVIGLLGDISDWTEMTVNQVAKEYQFSK